MTVLVVILIASLALVSHAYPHNTEKLDDGHHHHHHDFLDLAARIAASMPHNNTADALENLKPSQLMRCIPKEHRKKIRQQCERHFHQDPDHTPSVTAACILNMMNAVDNATGTVNTTMLDVLAIEPTSLTVDQKILASGSLKSCIESNFILPPPPDSVLVAKNMTKEEFAAKHDQNREPMRVMVCVVKALIENGCSSTSPIGASVGVPANSDDGSSSEEDSSHEHDDDELITGVHQHPLA